MAEVKMMQGAKKRDWHPAGAKLPGAKRGNDHRADAKLMPWAEERNWHVPMVGEGKKRDGHAPNAKMMGGAKKGILFTVCVLMLSISLLSFAIALSQHSAKNSGTVVSLLEIDRATDTYSNIEGQLVRIISSSMNISVWNDTVFVNASLPSSPQTAQDLDSFAQFERNYSELNLSMNLSNLKSLSFAIQPNGIAMAQDSHSFSITAQNSPGSSGAVREYDISLLFPAAGADAASWQVLSASNGSNSMPVHVRVQDESHSVNLDFYANVSKYSTSLLNITQGGSMVGYVQFSSPASLQVWHAGNIGLKASIGLTNPVYVEANDEISISSYANRTGKIRIA